MNQTRSTIWICLFAAIALLTTVISAKTHSWTTFHSDNVDVEIEVKEYVALTIGDTTLSWDVTSLDDFEVSTLEGPTTSTARATFNVEANANYYLTVTVTNTWNPSNLLPANSSSDIYARFDASGSSDFIAGTVFLDDDVSTVQGSGNLTGITSWNLGTGKVQTSSYGREKRQWGLGASFIVQYVGDSNSSRGIVGRIAPQDTYSTTATVTAALSP